MKQLIKRLARSVGYDIRKYRPSDSIETLVAHILKQQDINLVIDVGANTGQFGQLLRAEGYTGRIISVEPLADAHRQLQDVAANDSDWQVAARMALGAEDGELPINRSRNTVSSSILDMLPAHEESAPDSVYEAQETVPVRRLDSVLDEWSVGPNEYFLLKLDVQGYEDRVLDGATGVESRVAAVQCECSTVPLYDGQVLHSELMHRLEAKDFGLYAVWGGYADRSSGRMLQFDVLYVRDQDNKEEQGNR